MADKVFTRFSKAALSLAMQDSPVALLSGPRQSGKTTLVREFESDERRYITLDDDNQLSAALTDPIGFIRNLDIAIIDEAQRAPELMRAIKRSVDEDRSAGRFLLTGSADLMALPRIADSLAGRMERIRLLPLSFSEIQDRRPTFIDEVFEGRLLEGPKIFGNELVEKVLIGGYPEMVRRHDQRRRNVWARDYIAAIAERDIRDIADIDRIDSISRLIRLLAPMAGQLTNFSTLGGQIGLSSKTVQKYVGLLEQLYLVRRLPAWSNNTLSRVIKTPKLTFYDSGLLSVLRGINRDRVEKDRTAYGALLECFVAAEILKSMEWAHRDTQLYHYRTKDGTEVDLVLEDASGEVVGLEVKAAATVSARDFKGLKNLRSQTDIRAGVVLYDGSDVVPFGDNMWAAPISSLWG